MRFCFRLIVAFVAIAPAFLACAQCPAGTVEVSQAVVGKDAEGEIVEYHCRPDATLKASKALEQLTNAGEGKVNTATTFDGGGGNSAATATAPAVVELPGLPPISAANIQAYAKDPQFRAASQQYVQAAKGVEQAMARSSELRARQAATQDNMERQKIQIEIAKAEQEITAARGAERIASEKLKKEVVRLTPIIIDK